MVAEAKWATRHQIQFVVIGRIIGAQTYDILLYNLSEQAEQVGKQCLSVLLLCGWVGSMGSSCITEPRKTQLTGHQHL